MKGLKKIIKIVINGFTVVLLVILALIIYGKVCVTFSRKLYPNYFGYTVFEVASGSMKPTLDINDVILIKTGNENIKKGDIIAFEDNKTIITHRVLYIDGERFIVKGDNNNTADKPINKKQIIGVMIKRYPRLGLWKKVVTDPKILIGLFITLILFDFALSYKKQGDEKKEASINPIIRDDEIIISKVSKKNPNKLELNEPERLLELTRKIDIEEINKLIEDPEVKLNKRELNNIKKEINRYDESENDAPLDLSLKEKKFVDYTIRLDLSEIKRQIDSKIK